MRQPAEHEKDTVTAGADGAHRFCPMFLLFFNVALGGPEGTTGVEWNPQARRGSRHAAENEETKRKTKQFIVFGFCFVSGFRQVPAVNEGKKQTQNDK